MRCGEVPGPYLLGRQGTASRQPRVPLISIRSHCLFTGRKLARSINRYTCVEEMLHMEPSLEQQIRERAYEIWNANGCEDGRAAEHWHSAERELLTTQATAAAIEIRRSKKSKGERPRVTLSR
jgi:hypothetical protein